MTEYELLYLILETENSVSDLGQHIVTVLFAFVAVMYLYSVKLTKLVLVFVSVLYTAYVFGCMFSIAVYMDDLVAYYTILEGMNLSHEAITVITSGSTQETHYGKIWILSLWSVSYIVSMLIMWLSRNGDIGHGGIKG